MNNTSGEMEILRNNKKDTLEIKNSVSEMKNAFDGLISKLNMAEVRNPWAWCNNKLLKLKNKEKTDWKKPRTEYLKILGQPQKALTYV